MTFTVSPWWVVGMLLLALFGVVWWWQWLWGVARDVRAWWRDRRDAGESGVLVSGFRRLRAWERNRGEEDDGGRIDPPWWWKPWLSRRVEEDEWPEGILCAGCAGDSHCDGVEGGCDCTCGWPEDWADEELPPERSAEALGFTSPPPESPEVRHWHALEAKRERLASAAELEHRAAYEAMGLEYPSGLLARVREAAQ